jgi:hypothetical protein
MNLSTQPLNTLTPCDPLAVALSLPDAVDEQVHHTNSLFEIGEVVGWQANSPNGKPLLVRHPHSRKAFWVGGLSDLQTQQLPHLIHEMIGNRLVFSYDGEDPEHKGCPGNAAFMTLLASGDSLKEQALKAKLELMNGGEL